jgi:hypothetical protein
VKATEEMENRLKEETKSGWKDITTSILKTDVAKRSRRIKKSQVLNQRT